MRTSFTVAALGALALGVGCAHSAKREQIASAESAQQTAPSQQLAQQQVSPEEQDRLHQECVARHEAEQRAKAAEAQAAQAQQQAAQAKAEACRLKQAQSVASVKQEERGIVLTVPGNLLFAFGKSDLLPNAKRQLDQVATALKEDPQKPMLRVEGHTDSIGSDEFNQKLSEARASSVRDFLESRGIPSDRIDTEGFGESQPVADNSTPEGRANNRRVEIVLPTQQATGVGGAGQEQGTGGSGQQGISGSSQQGATGISGSSQQGVSGSSQQGVSGSSQQGMSGSSQQGMSGSSQQGMSGSQQGVGGSSLQEGVQDQGTGGSSQFGTQPQGAGVSGQDAGASTP